MNRRPYLLAAALLLCGAFIQTGCSKRPSKTIVSTGTIEMTEIQLSARTGGTLERILVKEGQTVNVGELLAELDYRLLDNQMASAQAALDAAVIRERQAKINLTMAQEQSAAQTRQAIAQHQAASESLKRAKSGARQQELAMAQNALDQAKAQYDLAAKTWQRQLTLYNDGLIPQAQLDQATSQKLVAEAQYQTAFNNHSLIQAGAREEEIAMARSQDESALAGVDLALSNKRLVQLRKDEIELSSAATRQAHASLTLLHTQRSYCQIKAPTAGIIANQHAQTGENVAAGANIFTLLDTERPWLKVYLSLTQVQRVRIGDRVQVILDAFPNQTFTGHVIQIANQAEFTPRNFQTKEERVKQVFAVKIGLNNSSGLLKAGMPADAEIFCHN